MDKLSQWIGGKQSRQKKRVTIYDFIFKQKQFNYIFYRLRYFFLGSVSDLCFHLITFYILLTQLSPSVFKYFILFTLLLRSINAFWWGATELLRTDVRNFYFFKQQKNAFNTISSWLGLSYCLSAVCVFFIIGLILLSIFHPGLISKAFLIYSILMLIYLALELPIRTYYFGVYAIQRVMRPVWSILGINILFSTVSLVLALYFNAYAIIMVYFIGAALKLFLTFYFTKQSAFIHNLEIKPLYSALLAIKNHSLKILSMGVFGVLLRFDNLLLFACAYSIGDFNKSSLLVALFLIIPMIHAGYDWSYLFYFDLKKLLTLHQKSLYQYFIHKLLLVTPIIGALCAMMGLLLLFIFHQDNHNFTLLLLIPWLAIRSLLGLAQIQAFTEFRYKDVLISSCILLLPGVFFILEKLDQSEFLLAVFLATIISALYCLLIKTRNHHHHEQKLPCDNIYQWLNRLLLTKQPATILRLKLNKPSIYPRNYFQQQQLPLLLQLFDELLFTGNHEIIGYTSNKTEINLSTALAKINHGDIQSQQSINFNPNELSKSALYLWLFNQPLESHFENYTNQTINHQSKNMIKNIVDSVIENFIKLFPNGQHYNPAPSGNQHQNISGSEIIYSANQWLALYRSNRVNILNFGQTMPVMNPPKN